MTPESCPTMVLDSPTLGEAARACCSEHCSTDRNAIYARPPAPIVIIHDWVWRRRGVSRVVSLALMKRVNLIRAPSPCCGVA
jgi:hypothetical protein